MQTQCFFEVLHRPARFAEFEQGLAEIATQSHRARAAAHRVLEVRQGLARAAALAQERSEVSERLGIGRAQLQRHAQLLDRGGAIAARRQGGGEDLPRLGFFGVESDRVTADGQIYVIEANPRASRTTPFIAKAYQIPYLNIATKVMLGENKLRDFKFVKRLKGYAIKEPVFSFEKFPGVNKELGPEMKSTGEAIRFIKDLRDPYFRQLYKDRSMYLSK